MNKTIKNIFMTAIAAAVLSAGTVSAHQFFRPYQTTCRGFCTHKTICPNILGCTCVFAQPQFPDNGTCNFTFAKPPSPAK